MIQMRDEHQMRLNRLPPRIRTKIVVTDSGCWEWTAGFNRNGYGAIWFIDQVRPAHRVVYELLIGPLPIGLVSDHLCRVRHCVNPDHIEPVTRRENVLRGTSLVADNARKTHCKYGHEFTESNTYYSKLGRACKACNLRNARQYRTQEKSIPATS